MYIPKKLRAKVYNKYGGLCAYSGTPLKDDWQVDHIVPVKKFEMGMDGNPNDIDNLMPVQRIINHYKNCLSLDKFKSWYLGGLHERLKKLPKNPRVKKSIRHKEYLLEVADLFGIKPDKPFDGKLYFEKIKDNK